MKSSATMTCAGAAGSLDYEAFNASDTAFYATCTNVVETGKPEYLRITDMKKQIDLMRASASLPYASRIRWKPEEKSCWTAAALTTASRYGPSRGYGRNVVS